MFNFNIAENISNIIERGGNTSMTDKEFFEREILRWKRSDKRKTQFAGYRYYAGEHDILKRKRTVIGEGGELREVGNLPNNLIVDNQYAKMVDQKVNYLLGKPITFDGKNDAFKEALQGLLGSRFQRVLKNLGEDALHGGIAWLYPYYDSGGELCFKRFEPFEILPFWKDAEHTVLDCALRLYEVQAYEGKKETIVEKVEIYRKTGIERYILQNNCLAEDISNPAEGYVLIDGMEYNWSRFPLIPFKYNNREIPLITRIKTLQDGINILISDFENHMQEDSRNTILVIKNYDGEDLGTFRQNLAAYGAVKVRTVDNSDGGVSTLNIDVNAENYRAVLEIFKKALIENARGFDAKNERMSGTPNQMNIQSMYSDVDLDANGMETEFQASLEELLWFVKIHFHNRGIGDFSNEKITVIFNRDILINESESIENCKKSVGILSNETIVSQHPWIVNIKEELERIEREKDNMPEYRDAFQPSPKAGDTA